VTTQLSDQERDNNKSMMILKHCLWNKVSLFYLKLKTFFQTRHNKGSYQILSKTEKKTTKNEGYQHSRSVITITYVFLRRKQGCSQGWLRCLKSP